ncbi:hypothetical protein CDIK_2099 [Cucumispora dikerogammari]|nr:hypothetical protein CDIK_2099 [Cucumispora dikerogammari]
MFVLTNRERNFLLICAINGERVLYSVVIGDDARAQDFKLFSQGLLSILARFGLRDSCRLFYDNVSIHHSREIKDFIDENELQRTFLSAYIYMLNQIEFCFGKVKTIIRNHILAKHNQSFSMSIVNAMDQITQSDMIEYFTLTRRNCRKALNKRDF